VRALILLLLSTSLAGQTRATLVMADTGGLFWHRGHDSIWVTNHTWVGHDSAPAFPDCVYSATNPRMMARDSMGVTISNHHWKWDRVLRPDETLILNWSVTMVGGTFTLVDISTPRSQCGVNAGQVWYHWRFEAWPLFRF
jgi:hypothetical protein